MKFVKTLFYLFIASFLMFMVSINQVDTTNWGIYVAWISGVILGVLVLIYILILVDLKIYNKKITKYLDSNDYVNLLQYSLKQQNRLLSFDFKTNSINYCILLSYLFLDEIDKAEPYFEKVDEMGPTYPLVYFWKACYLFNKNRYDEIKPLNALYISSKFRNKNEELLKKFDDLFQVILLFNSKDKLGAQQKLESVDCSDISMPNTLRVIQYIKEYKKPSEL